MPLPPHPVVSPPIYTTSDPQPSSSSLVTIISITATTTPPSSSHPPHHRNPPTTITTAPWVRLVFLSTHKGVFISVAKHPSGALGAFGLVITPQEGAFGSGLQPNGFRVCLDVQFRIKGVFGCGCSSSRTNVLSISRKSTRSLFKRHLERFDDGSIMAHVRKLTGCPSNVFGDQVPNCDSETDEVAL
nr:hypothetical protein [Tanacetum cinerariifolium]